MADSRLLYNCPGCGKKTGAPEGALTNRCEYCDLVVRVGSPGRVLKYFYESKIDEYGARMAVDRFLKDKGLPLSGQILDSRFFYLPFYRFRGMALDYLESSVEFIEMPEGGTVPIKSRRKLNGKNFDVTLPGFKNADFGLSSLGIRPAAVPLHGFSRSEIAEGTTIVRSDVSSAQAEASALELHRKNLGLYEKSSPLCSAMIGEQLSVIYFPVWAVAFRSAGRDCTVFVDALAKRGYKLSEGEFVYQGGVSGGKNSQFVNPIRHQCPNCGADLPVKHFSLYYPCTNCQRAYLLDGEGYRQVTPLTAESPLCAPYWRFPLVLEGGQKYKTVKDFYSLLTGEIAYLRREKRENQYYLYSPAFKATDVNRWTRAALGILKTQPHEKLEAKEPSGGPVFSIEEIEAKEMAMFLWQVATLKYPKLRAPEFQINPAKLPAGEIVWLPARDIQLLNKSLDYREVKLMN